MNLSDRIMAAVEKTRRALGDMVVSVTITKKTNSSMNSTTLELSQTVTTDTIEGFVAQWDEKEMDGELVRADDVKFYVFPTDFDVQNGDMVTLPDGDYSIVRTSPVKAGVQTALIMLQLRR